MGGSASSSSNYTNSQNTLNVNSSLQFINDSVMTSLQKTIVNSKNNCTQSFDSTAVLQISNISSAGNIDINNLILDAKNVVELECIIITDVLTQTENTFMSDNKANIASSLQTIQNSEFFNKFADKLQINLDSLPGFSSNSVNNTVSMTNATALSFAQSLTNKYQSTQTNITDINTVATIMQQFKTENKLVVNNLSAGGNVTISVLKLNALNSFSARAKLATTITNAIVSKMENVMGMQLKFNADTTNTQNGSTEATTDTSVSTTLNSLLTPINNAIEAASKLLGTPKVFIIVIGIGVIILGIGLIVGIVMIIKSLFASPSALDTLTKITANVTDKVPIKGYGSHIPVYGGNKEFGKKFELSNAEMNNIDLIIKNSFTSAIQDETLNLLKHL